MIAEGMMAPTKVGKEEEGNEKQGKEETPSKE